MVMTGAERTKKNYDANREAILAKRRQRYQANKAKKLAIVEPIVEPIYEPIVEPIYEPNLANGELPPDESELFEIPLVEEEVELSVLEKVTNMINELPDETAGNKKFRIKNFASLIRILNPPNYKEFIKALKCRPNQTIKLIKKFQHRPNKTYASNTLISLYKAICVL